MALSVEEQIFDILGDYADNAKETAKKCAKTVASDCVSKLKSESPKDTGEYAKSWTKKMVDNGYIVHNSKHYQLTHLLENGHIKRGGKGRVPAIVHIAPVEEWGINEYLNEIKRELER